MVSRSSTTAPATAEPSDAKPDPLNSVLPDHAADQILLPPTCTGADVPPSQAEAFKEYTGKGQFGARNAGTAIYLLSDPSAATSFGASLADAAAHADSTESIGPP